MIRVIKAIASCLITLMVPGCMSIDHTHNSYQSMLDQSHNGKDIVLGFPIWVTEENKFESLKQKAQTKALQKCPGSAYKLINIDSTSFKVGASYATARISGISANIQCTVKENISTTSRPLNKDNINNLRVCHGGDITMWSNCFAPYTYPNGNVYVGEFKNGMPGGQGTYTWINGSKYVGEFNNGREHGRGIFYSSNGIILNQGTWADGKLIRSESTHPTITPNTEFEKVDNELENTRRRQTPK